MLCEVEEVVADRVDVLGRARAGPLLEELREFALSEREESGYQILALWDGSQDLREPLEIPVDAVPVELVEGGLDGGLLSFEPLRLGFRDVKHVQQQPLEPADVLVEVLTPLVPDEWLHARGLLEAVG